MGLTQPERLKRTTNLANNPMKTILNQLRKTLTPLVFLALPALVLLVLASCSKQGAATKPPDVDYYTCTMHPSVKSQDPNAKCPICSMDLVPVKKKGTAASPAAAQESNQAQMQNMPGMAMPSATTNATEQPSEFTVPVERQQQIGVTYGKIEKRPLVFTIRAVGLVASDKQRRWDYVTRVDGYVEKLFVFSPGEIVEPDAPLLTIFSPDLLTTENEFLDVLKTHDDTLNKGDRVVLESTQHLVDAAKQRLHLWNITDAQIAELEKTRQPQETLTLKSPFKGIVQTLGVDQGRRVMVGDRLVEVADLSVVWVWAQFYENELGTLKKGLPVAITTSSYPGETFHGEISVVDPFLSDASRTGRVRIDVDNPGLKLRPEMYVNAELKLDLGVGLAVPVSAVLPTGQHNIVFVEKGGGKLEPRFVDLGRKFGELYEILTGLKENERVVTSANFLIDAEAKVQGALKSW